MNTSLEKYMGLKMISVNGMLVSDICGNNCIFCSNYSNPEEIHTYKIGNRNIKDLINEIDLIPNSVKYLSIGETAYNTTEGEILIYPHLKELVSALKTKRPDIKLNICTSGSHLTIEKIDFIINNKISLIFSLHSINIKERARLMNCSEERAATAINGIKELINKKADFEAVRLVPTEDTADQDIYETLKFLIENNIPQIEIFAASYSKNKVQYNVQRIKKECQRFSKILDNLYDIRNKHFSKVVICPFMQYKKNIYLECVKLNSYAEKIGLKAGDIINSINNKKINTNEEFYNNINKIPCIININNNQNIIIEKDILSDIFLNQATENIYFSKIQNLLKRNQSHILIMVGEASAEILLDLFQKFNLKPNYQIVKNEVFGGSLCGNGLLTVKDLLKNIKDYREKNPNKNITQIIIPKDIFKFGTIDVLGEDIKKLKLEACVDIILV